MDSSLGVDVLRSPTVAPSGRSSSMIDSYLAAHLAARSDSAEDTEAEAAPSTPRLKARCSRRTHASGSSRVTFEVSVPANIQPEELLQATTPFGVNVKMALPKGTMPGEVIHFTMPSAGPVPNAPRMATVIESPDKVAGNSAQTGTSSKANDTVAAPVARVLFPKTPGNSPLMPEPMPAPMPAPTAVLAPPRRHSAADLRDARLVIQTPGLEPSIVIGRSNSLPARGRRPSSEEMNATNKANRSTDEVRVSAMSWLADLEDEIIEQDAIESSLRDLSARRRSYGNTHGQWV